MNLKWFHIVFIVLSTLMSMAVGVWGLFNNFIVLGAVSLVGSAGLCVYGTYFYQKARRLGWS
jgi:hypothetical protein